MFEPFTARELASFVICLAFVGGYYLKWRANDIAERALNKPNPSIPQPIVVKEAEQFVSVAEFKRLQDEINRHRENDAREAAIRRKGIYDKIDKSREDVLTRMDETRKELESKLEDNRHQMEENIKSIHTRVDNIPDRVIATLRNTGAIS